MLKSNLSTDTDTDKDKVAAPLNVGNSPLQPEGPKRKVAGAHWSQFLPMMLGRHWHWPPLGSHTVLREPIGSHAHAGDNRKK